MVLLLCLIGLHKIISVKLMKCDQRFCTLGGGYGKRGTKRRRAGVELEVVVGGWFGNIVVLLLKREKKNIKLMKTKHLIILATIVLPNVDAKTELRTALKRCSE